MMKPIILSRWLCLFLTSVTNGAHSFSTEPFSIGLGLISNNKKVVSTLYSNAGGLFGDDTQRIDALFSFRSGGKATGRFATGKQLKLLRSDLEALRENLNWAKKVNDEARVAELTQAIRNGEKRDPDLMYTKALREVVDSKASYFLSEEERTRRVEKWEKEAAEARLCLARFDLEGLWVGKYGDSGEEIVNVTYAGDTLIATKVTGDANVPRGKISFTAELSPSNSSALQPLTMSLDNEATQLLRYPGKGQVAQPGFVNRKFIEGQLIMFDEHFSFVWVPTNHNVLFRRPSPEQTLRLLRDTIAVEDEVENMRNHLIRCYDMDMTDSLARMHAQALGGIAEEPFRRISFNSELMDQTPIPVTDRSRFTFWQVNKWRDYIDYVLKNADKEKKN